MTALPPEDTDLGETLAILHLNENGTANMAYWMVYERPANLRWRGLFKTGTIVTRRSPPFKYDKVEAFDHDALADYLEADRALFVIEGGRE